MIELKTQTYRQKVEIKSWIANKFKNPIIFYLAHREDSRALLITFTILDLANSEIVFIVSYLPENKLKVQSSPEKNKFFISAGFNPHCSIQIKPKEDFFTFIERRNFFYYINYQENILRVYTGNDLNLPEKNELGEFGSTFYKDAKDANCFYITAVSQNKDNEMRLNFYKTKLDLSDLENIFSTSTPSPMAPHVTKQYKNYLLSSEFGFRKFKNKGTGKVYLEGVEYMIFVFEDLYREYCSENNKKFSQEEFKKNNLIEEWKVNLESEFSVFCQKKGNNFLEICENNEKYNFEMLPGIVTVLDIEKKLLKSFETTFCTPAHFEIDLESDVVYTSSHNFVILDKLYFLGPAAIDKFVIKDGELEKVGTFSEKNAFRFTTHKIFGYKNRKYVCSFGQPNRLYFIDADSMKMLYYDDIEVDLLSDKEDVRFFLNNNNLEPFVMKTIEVSSDGEVLFLLSHKYIYFYSFPERRILQRIDYRDFELGGGQNLHDYYNRTTHSDYLI